MNSKPIPQNEDIEEITKIFQAKGKKLGFLISQLAMSNETKQALLTIIKEMNLEQLNRLSDILENKYLAEKTKDVDAELMHDLGEINKGYLARLKKIDKKALAALDKLEEKI